MATIQETQKALLRLANNSSSGLVLNYDDVVTEVIKNKFAEQNTPLTQGMLDNIKKYDYDENPSVRSYYERQIAVFKIKTSSLSEQITQVPIIQTGIVAASTGVTAPAALPQRTSLKSIVSAMASQLADALNICTDLGIGAPDALVTMITEVSSLKVLVEF